MSESGDKALRHQLAELLRGRGAHMDAEAVFGPVRDQDWGNKAVAAPHSLWELLEHCRIAFEDLYTFSTDPNYAAPEWPREYWPAAAAPPNTGAAKASLKALLEAQQKMIHLVHDQQVDLFAKIPWGDGQTVLREALLAADHTSYHVGQAMYLRKQLESKN